MAPCRIFLDQAILLNKTGIDFIELSSTTEHDALHIALRILRESQKTMEAVKQTKAEK